MTRLGIRFLTTAVLLVALAAVLGALAAAPGTPGMPAAGPGMRIVDGSASPTPSPSPTCRDCLSPNDAICWEAAPPRCDITVTLPAPAPTTIMIRFRTVAMSARPGVDYVDVPDGVVIIQAGALAGDAVVYLIPDPGLNQPRTFGVRFTDPSYGRLTRPQALVTIMPGAPGPS